MKENLSTKIDMAIAYLKKERIIRFQKEVAERMGVDVNTVSRAKNGSEYNSESFAMRFNAAFGFIFSTEWLLYGKGEMLSNKKGISSQTNEREDVIKATEPEQSSSVYLSDIPAWADSLIHLVTDNTIIIQSLRDETKQLKELLAAVIRDNNKLRQDLSNAIISLHRPAIYTGHIDTLPMAAEKNK